MLLNVRSVYSLLSSTLRINDYVARGAQLGYDILGLADHSVLHGALEFHNVCLKHNIKPLYGLKVEILGIYRQDQKFSFLVYAMDQEGFRQLSKLSRLLTSHKVSDVSVWDYLASQDLSLVYISLGKDSEMEKSLIQGQRETAMSSYQSLVEVFGQDNVYLGTSVYPYNQVEIETQKQFAQAVGIQLVATQEVRTLRDSQAFSLRILEAIGENEVLEDLSRQMKGTQYLMSSQELRQLYRDLNLDSVWANTRELADRLNVQLDTNQSYLPKFQVPEDYTSDSYLEELVRQRLDELDKTQDPLYQERLEHELKTIQEMGFSDYFLIVWEIIAYCHQHKIRVGPGRGSAAGSLVSYLLQITLVDPIQYNLYFERFLNPERRNMPDIDIDIPDDKRDQVLKYVSEKYGYNQVAQIVTMGTFGAKQSVRDTLRVMGADADTLRRWSRAIPTDGNNPMTLHRAYQESSDLKQLVDSSEFNRNVFETALTIEGIPRNLSTHAAAVVINDFPLEQIIPVQEREDSLLITQYDMYDVEQMGLLKMDFLGLRNLSILDATLSIIEEESNVELDIREIDMDDPATLELFQQGDTNGVFQFESDGIKNVLKRLKPESFEDIVAVNALYRPGPMKQIDSYIKRKRGQEQITYVHSMLEPILKSTYGIIVYQEQVMQIVVSIAGFSLGEADVLRRAISKKDIRVMEEERVHFIEGSMANGFTLSEAEEVYNYIYEFSNYGFNRAHAVVYSTLAFQLAYLKIHYPQAFFPAVLNLGDSGRKTYDQYLQEARRRLDVLPIDINLSQGEYSFEDGLRVGFNAIKGLRNDFIEFILDDRSLLGPYSSFMQFLHRLPDKFMKEDYLESLIRVGAFDRLDYNRHTLIENLSVLIKSLEYSGLSLDLFEDLTPKVEYFEEYSIHERLKDEHELLGFSVSGHPVKQYAELLTPATGIVSIQNLNMHHRGRVRTIGMVVDFKRITTKNDQPMAFVTINNEVEELELILFPNLFQQFKSKLEVNQVVVVEGKPEIRKGKPQLIIHNVQLAQDYNSSAVQGRLICFLQLFDFQEDKGMIEEVIQLADQNPGPCPIVLVDRNRQIRQLGSEHLIASSYRVRDKLISIFGKENVVFQAKDSRKK